MKIGIIIGSTRPGRNGAAVGQWAYEQATSRADATYELIDLAEYQLPLLCEPTIPAAASGSYETPETQMWADKISEFDGYIFVTPEYNHSVPAAMKNAFDVLASEWRGKAVAFISYGGDGGIRAVQHWRHIVANLAMFDARNHVALGLFTDFDAEGFAPVERRNRELAGVLEELEALVKLTQLASA